MHTTDRQTQDTADLERPGAELAAYGLQANVRTLGGRLPHLDVSTPRAARLSEKVYVQGDSYWWPWAERISGCDDVAAVAPRSPVCCAQPSNPVGNSADGPTLADVQREFPNEQA